MQSRIEEMSSFESEIKNKPIKLLEAIKEKMYDPSRVKYEYASLTDSMIRVLVGTKQEFNEDLVDYTKRFKQAKDIFKQSVGDNILDNFIEHTKEYKDTSDSNVQDNLKKKGFNKWMTYLYMKNADSTKCGSLITKFQTEYSLGNNQYPRSMTSATDALSGHRWDKQHGEQSHRRT